MADNTCEACHKGSSEVPSMKRCAKCQKTYYCSRDCQKADWKVHKKICSSLAGAASKSEDMSSYSSPQSKSLETYISDPFTRIDKGIYLHNRLEKDVFKLLIDSFRMRQADAYNMEGKTTPQSLYTGAASSIVPFREFLGRVERKQGYLPSWWNVEKKKECEEFGESGENFSSLKKKVTKDDIIKHYSDDKMPMQLRMFAEEALGEPAPGAFPGAGKMMRSQLKAMEAAGPSDETHYSMLNVDPSR